MFDTHEFHQINEFIDHLNTANNETELKSACETVITGDYIETSDGFEALASLVYIKNHYDNDDFELSQELKDLALDAANQLMRDDENGLYDYMNEHGELDSYLDYLDDIIENILE